MWGIGDLKFAVRGKIFPKINIIIIFFKNFDIGDVWGRLRGVGDPKSAVGGKIFPKIILFYFQEFRHFSQPFLH